MCKFCHPVLTQHLLTCKVAFDWQHTWHVITQTSYPILYQPEALNGMTVNDWMVQQSKLLAKHKKGELKVQINAPHSVEGQSILKHRVISENAWQIWHLIYKSSYPYTPSLCCQGLASSTTWTANQEHLNNRVTEI